MAKFEVYQSGKKDEFRFRLKGLSAPGLSRLTISWSDKTVVAKWDETPNPLERDDLSKFRPELVPATYDQPLFCGNEYVVPVLIERNGRFEIFSGLIHYKTSLPATGKNPVT